MLGSINDTCIMIRILIQKMYQVSSIMIHFWYSISISITDTFQVYQYHKSLIRDCDTFTGIQNFLLTMFASRELFVQSVHNCASNSDSSPCSLETNREVEDDFFDCRTMPSTDSAVSAVDRKFINYLSDTESLTLKMLAKYSRTRKVFIKFNTTLPSSAPVERLFNTARQTKVLCRNHLSDSSQCRL